jgi:hypothetical protein
MCLELPVTQRETPQRLKGPSTPNTGSKLDMDCAQQVVSQTGGQYNPGEEGQGVRAH